MGVSPHGFLGGLLFPPLLRVAVEGQVTPTVGRAPAQLSAAQLQLAVGWQRVLIRRVVLVFALAGPSFVCGWRRPGVLGCAARAQLRAQLGRRLQAAPAAAALRPRLALQHAAQVRVIVLGRGARGPAHQARQRRILWRPAACGCGAVGPATLPVSRRLATASAPVVLIQRAVLVEGTVGPRLRALEAAPRPRLVAVAIGAPRPLAVRVCEGCQLVHRHGRHARGKVLPRQHLRFGALLAAGRWSLVIAWKPCSAPLEFQGPRCILPLSPAG
uniref:Uncharacterized protein n=1 Tax=Mus musculus TaxID=10090 RepID=Q8BST1_MOUSE|nr:unnamed protein product [Mus musculus]